MGLRPLELVEEMERRGLRTTPPHLAVYRAADELAGQDVSVIVARARESLDDVSDETALASLEALAAAGLLRRVGSEDAPSYEPGATTPAAPPA